MVIQGLSIPDCMPLIKFAVDVCLMALHPGYAVRFPLTFFIAGFLAVATFIVRSVRMRCSKMLAGSSFGFCGTSWPEKAALRMFLRWAADCFRDVSTFFSCSIISIV